MNNSSSFTTKKYLGQHLLIDDSVIANIINYAPNLNNTIAIEVGPGTANLTKKLLTVSNFVFAIEKDSTTQPFLEKLKAQYPNKFDYIIADALTVNLLDVLNQLSLNPNTQDCSNYAIISNLPYNVGTLLFTSWLPIANRFQYFLLMFQLEVAQRITAPIKHRHYGRLALYSSIFGKSQLCFTVDKSSFMPAPKVDSAVILFTSFATSKDIDIPKFEYLTKLLFNTKRKMLRQSLKNFNIDFDSLKINPMARPQDLSLEEFCILTKAINFPE